MRDEHRLRRLKLLLHEGVLLAALRKPQWVSSRQSDGAEFIERSFEFLRMTRTRKTRTSSLGTACHLDNPLKASLRPIEEETVQSIVLYE